MRNLCVVAAGVAALVSNAAGESDDLKSKVQELEQQLKSLQRQIELQGQASAEKAKTTPVLSAGASGFSFRSADSNFVLRLRGYLQADSRWYIDDAAAGKANDTFLLRRVRPIFEGTVWDKYDFRIMLDFGSAVNSTANNDAYLQDAYFTARWLPEFQLVGGKMKEPVSNQEGALRSFVSPGQQRIFGYSASAVADGDHWRVAPQGYWYWGPFGLFGEYIVSNQEVVNGAASDDLEHTAWQVAASYVLTGEKNSWRGITPKRPFSLRDGGWGAFEVAARYQHLEFDDGTFPTFASASGNAREANSWGVGLNWHLNRNFKLQVNYENTDFKGGTSEVLRDGEQIVFTRAQIRFSRPPGPRVFTVVSPRSRSRAKRPGWTESSSDYSKICTWAAGDAVISLLSKSDYAAIDC